MLILLGAAMIALVFAVTFVGMFREGPADSDGSSSEEEDGGGSSVGSQSSGHDHTTISDGHDD